MTIKEIRQNIKVWKSIIKKQKNKSVNDFFNKKIALAETTIYIKQNFK